MTQAPHRILIVDDDPALLELLERYLGEQGFVVAGVPDGEAMDHYLAENEVDLIILDLMLPGEDGLSIAKRLRVSGTTPILMLSARGDDVDRIVGLEVGADDYLAKPFNPRELLARLRAILRRRQPDSPGTAVAEPAEVYRFGDFCLDMASRTLTRGGEQVALTSGEYALLQVFVENPNRVLSRDALVDRLAGYERSPFDRSIDVRVTRLRRKIEADPSAPVFIQTVWGEGYRFSPGAGA
jgi:two-component system phosphate regulon response regulator OmpR